MPRITNIYKDAQWQRRLMTPAICARRVPGILLWYNADFLTLDSSGLVSGATDLSNNGRHSTNVSGERLTYFPSDVMYCGRPSFGSTTTGGNRRLLTPVSLTPSHVFISCYYKDGIDNTFDVLSYFLSGTGGFAAPRIMGGTNTANLATGSSNYASTVSKNGAPESAVVLPLPVAVFQANASNKTGTYSFGGSSLFADRVLVGAFRNCVFADLLSSYEQKLVQGVMAWDTGCQNALVDNHPFKNRPPLLGD